MRFLNENEKLRTLIDSSSFWENFPEFFAISHNSTARLSVNIFSRLSPKYILRLSTWHEILFTNDNFGLAISWKTREIKSLFKTKDKNLYTVCKIYYGDWEKCGDYYKGGTVRNTVTRWSEHNNCDYKSEPAERIKRNIEHVFKWKMLCSETQRKNLEVIFIALYKPSLNDQKSFDRIMLFGNKV